jgi:hypothetical protein
VKPELLSGNDDALNSLLTDSSSAKETLGGPRS